MSALYEIAEPVWDDAAYDADRDHAWEREQEDAS